MIKYVLMGYDQKYGKAAIYAIVLSAVIHVAISFFAGLFRGDIVLINMFHVLGFDLIWPELGKGDLNAFLGVIYIIFSWIVFLVILTYMEHNAKNRQKKRSVEADEKVTSRKKA